MFLWQVVLLIIMNIFLIARHASAFRLLRPYLIPTFQSVLPVRSSPSNATYSNNLLPLTHRIKLNIIFKPTFRIHCQIIWCKCAKSFEVIQGVPYHRIRQSRRDRPLSCKPSYIEDLEFKSNSSSYVSDQYLLYEGRSFEE